MANITSTTIKKGIESNGYTAQKLGFDNRRPFNLGLSSQKSESSPFKATEGKYYYKIGGKSVTKAEYNAYENPVGDGPTKSTNDPDPSGRIARTQAAREKLPRPSTVLTEAQMKVKDQGTKVKKKPPFKVKVKGKKLPKGYTEKDKKFLEEQREDVVRREDLDEKGKKLYDKRQAQIKAKKKAKKSPIKNKFLNRIQKGLSAAGMVPGIGNVADIANTALSGGRAAYAKYKGDTKGAKKHLANMAINATSAIPGLGLAAGGAKLAKAGVKAAKSNKSLKAIKEIKGVKDLASKTAKNVKQESVKRTTKMAAKENIGSKIDSKPKKKLGDGKIYAEKRKANKIVSKNIA